MSSKRPATNRASRRRPSVKVAAPPPAAIAYFKFELGDTARDVITGLQGIVTARCQYLTGCTQFLIQPPGAKQGQPQASHWVDEGKLVRVAGKRRVSLVIEANGGPQLNEAPKH